ncbi:MAG: bluetail domain-containing putative surface protein [Rhizomicrobium sp.]
MLAGDAAVAKADAFTIGANALLGPGKNLFADNGSGADGDPDSGNFAITAVNGSAGNLGHQIALASGALLTVNADGTFSYDPDRHFDDLAASASGASDTSRGDSFSYAITGGSTATVDIAVSGVDNGNTVYKGTAGDDHIAGGDNGNLFDLADGGNDTATGGSGNDGLAMGGAYTSADRIDGGAGTDDQLQLDAAYGSQILLLGAAIRNIEVIAFGPTHSYAVFSNGLSTAGQDFSFWSVSMDAAHAVNIDASLEPGNLHFYLGQGNDHVTGGPGNDVFYGEGGADGLQGRGGADTYVYLNVSDSAGSSVDSVQTFVAGTDKFDLPVPVTGIDTAVTMTGNEAADAAATQFIGAGQLAPNHAVLLVPGQGAFFEYLVVDANGIAGYQSGQDFIFDVSGLSGTLTTSDFI